MTDTMSGRDYLAEKIARKLQPRLFDDAFYATVSDEHRKVNGHFRRLWIQKAREVLDVLDEEGVL